MLHALADGWSTVCTASCDALCVNVKVASVKSYEPGAIESVTSIGDKWVLVNTTVSEAGTDEAYVESPLEDKAVVARVVIGVGKIAMTTAGDGANDVLASVAVDTGAVTIDGMLIVVLESV